MLVNNVHEFPGHIACDPQNKSEIVIPLIKEENVLDIDSTFYSRFDQVDQTYLERFVDTLMKHL